MKTKNISFFIVAVCIVMATVAILTAFSHGMDSIHIGVLLEQKDFFPQTDKITESTGKNIIFHYYGSYEDMKKDIASGVLDIYTSPLFEHIVDTHEHLAVAAIPADYILAGIERKNPTPIGVTEYRISGILIRNANALKDRKFTTLFIEEEEKIPFLREKIIDFAIFRNQIPQELEEQGFSQVIALSELGFHDDVLCVKKELLLRYDSLVESIFMSSSLDSHMLPSEEEVKNAVQYLFKSGAIPERKEYTEYVHIK